MKKFFAWIFIMILGVAVVLAAFVFSLNKYIEQYGQRYITDAHSIQSADAIIVLGALVYDDGILSCIRGYVQADWQAIGISE